MKKITTILAIVGVMTASVPAMASASTVQNHANMLSITSSYSVSNILPNSTSTNTWGTSTLTADNTNQRFFWQVSPTNMSKSYTYYLVIDYYSDYTYTTYVGSITIPTVNGAGVLSGYASYPTRIENGGYYARINGTWNASDGAGYVGNATTPFTINQ
ncbi:MAG: hypothetical protein ACXVPK_12305 [Tumebacillaceae bacterium]